MRRIFAEYRGRASYRAIAAGLTRDEVPPPRNGRPRKSGEPGWSHVTIRHLLTVEQYVGRWIYNKSKWTKSRATGRRKNVTRPRSEWMTREDPTTRIIDDETWLGVQVLLRPRAPYRSSESNEAPAHRGRGGRPVRYPFSGLLICGVCGGPMDTDGGAAGRRYYCCKTFKEERCGNGLRVRESVVREHLTRSIVMRLRTSAVRDYVLTRVMTRIEQTRALADGERSARVERLRSNERALANLMRAVEDGDMSRTIRQRLKQLEDIVDDQRAELAEMQAVTSLPVDRGAIEQAVQRVLNVAAAMVDEAGTLRLALEQLLGGGRIRLVPDPLGATSYTAIGDLLPLAVTMPGAGAEAEYDGKPLRRSRR